MKLFDNCAWMVSGWKGCRSVPDWAESGKKQLKTFWLPVAWQQCVWLICIQEMRRTGFALLFSFGLSFNEHWALKKLGKKPLNDSNISGCQSFCLSVGLTGLSSPRATNFGILVRERDFLRFSSAFSRLKSGGIRFAFHNHIKRNKSDTKWDLNCGRQAKLRHSHSQSDGLACILSCILPIRAKQFPLFRFCRIVFEAVEKVLVV